MIARIWHGYTTPQNANSYEALLKPELLPGLSKLPGYRASFLIDVLRTPASRRAE